MTDQATANKAIMEQNIPQPYRALLSAARNVILYDTRLHYLTQIEAHVPSQEHKDLLDLREAAIGQLGEVVKGLGG